MFLLFMACELNNKIQLNWERNIEPCSATDKNCRNQTKGKYKKNRIETAIH